MAKKRPLSATERRLQEIKKANPTILKAVKLKPKPKPKPSKRRR